jgi:hypothetical protein
VPGHSFLVLSTRAGGCRSLSPNWISTGFRDQRVTNRTQKRCTSRTQLVLPFVRSSHSCQRQQRVRGRIDKHYQETEREPTNWAWRRGSEIRGHNSSGANPPYDGVSFYALPKTGLNGLTSAQRGYSRCATKLLCVLVLLLVKNGQRGNRTPDTRILRASAIDSSRSVLSD